MKPIRILIIDDQYARDDFLRLNLITTTGITESGARRPAANGIETAFCSGQSTEGNAVKNDYGVIADAVTQGWGENAAWQWNLVLLDVRFDSGVLDKAGKPKGGPEDDKFGVSVRKQLRGDFPDLPVVMFSSKHESEIKDSQEHYLSKEGIDARRLMLALLDWGRLEMGQARQLLCVGDEIVFASSGMLNVYRDAYWRAKSDDPILILGESGSGKEKLASYIHHMSSRSKGPFVAKNMAELPDGQEESILFGTDKTAYPQAKDAGGLFEEADKGTLFLDEIGEMPETAQPKILRAVQQKKVRRVGGRKDITVDVRFISATNRNLDTQNSESKVRSDLVHRLNAVTITVPPLRERRDDIVPLAQSFLNEAMKVNGSVGIRLSDEAMNKLCQYDFPGNVRELENMIKALVSRMGNNRVIKPDAINLPEWKGEPPISPGPDEPPNKFSVSANLSNLHEIIAALPVDKDDPALQGIKPRMEDALRILMQRCAGAALESSKDTMRDEYPLQPAMQLLKGDTKLTSTGPKRLLNEILGRNLETNIQEVDKQNLLKLWKSAGKTGQDT